MDIPTPPNLEEDLSFLKVNKEDAQIPIPSSKFLQTMYQNLSDTEIEKKTIGRPFEHERAYDSYCRWYVLPTQLKKPKTTICIALDKSFNFYYHDNLDALKREGARIKFFSPIYDSKLPTCDGLYIGGGFPEILSDLLEKNQKMKKSIKNAAENNIPIYAECGGLMYLTRSISYGNKKHQMVGLFDAETRMDKKMKLNYTKGKISSNCLISPKSNTLQGHEFHYSEIDILSNDSKFAYALSIGEGIKNKQDGLMEYNTLASYMHLYFDHSKYAKNFVQNCIKFSKR